MSNQTIISNEKKLIAVFTDRSINLSPISETIATNRSNAHSPVIILDQNNLPTRLLINRLGLKSKKQINLPQSDSIDYLNIVNGITGCLDNQKEYWNAFNTINLPQINSSLVILFAKTTVAEAFVTKHLRFEYRPFAAPSGSVGVLVPLSNLGVSLIRPQII